MRYASIVVVALLAGSKSQACTCSHPSANDESLVTQEADVVFIGEVAEVAKATQNGIEVVQAKFKVLENRKGVSTKFITIHVSHGGTSCDLMRSAFRPGERYLISGTDIRWRDPERAALAAKDVTTKHVYNNFCDLRERLDVTPGISLERTRER